MVARKIEDYRPETKFCRCRPLFAEPERKKTVASELLLQIAAGEEQCK